MADFRCLISGPGFQLSAFRWMIEGPKRGAINVIPLIGANLRKKEIVSGQSSIAYGIY